LEPARWELVQELFEAAAGLPATERAAYLLARCAGDEALAAEVEELCAEDGRASPLLDRGVAWAAQEVVLAAAGEPLPPPRTFGPYDVRSLLGEGGMGVVYLAEREDLGSLAAIKVLRDAWLSPARRERFAAEQRTLAHLVHPSIAQLHDAGTLEDGTPWIVMEYVAGVPLTQYCREHDTTLEGRLELFRSVCRAVQHAHAQAVIHRDLKPSNILVKADGSVKLLDFGIAKQLEALDDPVERTATVARFMTPAYAAPEQLRGERAGVHGDVYSLGVILYELLAQRLPFDPATEASAARERAPRPPSALAGAGVRARAGGRPSWADLDVLCLTALQEDPARRYPTVEALARDVDHYLAGEPLEARRDTLGYRLAKLVGRHRRAVLATGAAALLLLALAVTYTARLRAARNTARAEATRAARIQRFMLSLFDGGDEAVGPPEDLRVSTLLERGVEEARALDREPVVQAELHRTLGGLYQKLGAFDAADAVLEGALARQRALLGERHVETSGTKVLLGLLRMDEARLAEAEELVRAGLDGLRAALPAAHPSLAQATAALGQVLEAAGDYRGAQDVNEEAVRLAAAIDPDGPEHVAALGQLADSHYYAGHYALADELNERVLAGARRIYGERHPRVADVLINLGASLGDRGRYAEAEALYREALTILDGFHGPDHHKSASARTMLGRALVYQGRFAEGVALLEEALAVQERVNGPEHPRVASILNDLGSAALQEDRLDEAQGRFERMLAIYRAVYPDGHALVGTATSNLASVLVAKGEYTRAEGLYREAIAVFERALSPEHLSTGIARIKLGRALLRQGRFAEAERETLAGHEVVRAQASPSVSWLRSARADLVAIYEALGEPERAAPYRDSDAEQR